MIITELAKQKIREIAESERIGHTNIRVSIKGQGCSGYAVEMEYDNIPGELDEILEIDDIKIIIDPISFQYVSEMTMDYLSYALGEGFKFSGGGSTSCACGSSLSF